MGVKNINGKVTEFICDFMYNKGNVTKVGSVAKTRAIANKTIKIIAKVIKIVLSVTFVLAVLGGECFLEGNLMGSKIRYDIGAKIIVNIDGNDLYYGMTRNEFDATDCDMAVYEDGDSSSAEEYVKFKNGKLCELSVSTAYGHSVSLMRTREGTFYVYNLDEATYSDLYGIFSDEFYPVDWEDENGSFGESFCTKPFWEYYFHLDDINLYYIPLEYRFFDESRDDTIDFYIIESFRFD